MPLSNSLKSAASQFDQWARNDLFEKEHRLGTDLLEQAVDVHLENLYAELELHDKLRQPTSAKTLAETLGFSDSAWIALDAMLMRLAKRRNLMEVRQDNDILIYTALKAPENRNAELADFRARCQSMGEHYIAPMEFLEFGAEHFVRSMRDDHTFMDRVLTGQESEFSETWNRATNTDPLQDVHGIMGAKALDLLFEGGTILEVGGGTGNGIRNNLLELDRSGKLSKLDSYVFTDVSMQFIVGTRNEFKGQYPSTSCEWRLLNINKDFAKQRIEADSADIVYGVNAAHIAERTVDFLMECKRVLRPGGLVVFSERIRRHEHDMAPREIVLNQSSYHRTAAQRHPEYRPAHAYLAREHWLRACELAGYSEFEVWPSVESVAGYFPDQYAVVVVAKV
ncbi:MAG: class I SAM-dependent methyltransferase [Granulosicoccus sp.]